jgi:hypothetical protein
MQKAPYLLAFCLYLKAISSRNKSERLAGAGHVCTRFDLSVHA